MIVLFTDFGYGGPYVGQVKARLIQDAPGADLVDLFHDAPSRRPQAAAYLLAAYDDCLPPGTVFLCVVDPGVGGDRLALILEADGRWYVGPDNGLFEIVARRASGRVTWREITWRPQNMSATFHGRDLFAPVAAALAGGATGAVEKLGRLLDRPPGGQPDWPDDLDEIVYVDHFGNAITGRRAETLAANFAVSIGGELIPRMITYSDVSLGEIFCYVNSNGLVEIAVNYGDAAETLKLRLGSKIKFNAQ